MPWTADDLLDKIKVRAQVPISQSTFTEPQILSMADDYLQIKYLPLILKVRENYYQTHKDQNVTSGTSDYRIPSRAIGGKLKEVQLLDPAGRILDLAYIPTQERHFYQTTPSQPLGFELVGHTVRLVPTPNVQDYTLRLHFFRRPGLLVKASAAAVIASIDSTNKQVTVTSLPSTITSSTPVDLIQATPGFETLAMDQSVLVSGTTLTFPSDLPDQLAVGDYVALAGQTPIVQLPAELHSVLASRVAVQLLRSLGHHDEADKLKKDVDELEEEALRLINPRVDGEAKKIIARNGVLNPDADDDWLTRW